MREVLKKLPVVGPAARALARLPHRLRALRAGRHFRGSADHWEEKYASGGDSGRGSYGVLAEFKAEVLNDFVAEFSVGSVVELGCGDGNQLSLAHYPSYLGLDVSSTAVELCKERFAGDPTKQFIHYDPASFASADHQAELAMSLDVLFHLVEDAVFERYMATLFDLGTRHVAVYSSDREDESGPRMPHVRHRRFTPWVREHRPDWKLLREVPNRHPFQGDARTGSFSNFYFFSRSAD